MFGVLNSANVVNVQLVYFPQSFILSLECIDTIFKLLNVKFYSPFFILFLSLNKHGLLFLNFFILGFFGRTLITIITFFNIFRVNTDVIVLGNHLLAIHIEAINGNLLVVLQGFKELSQVGIFQIGNKRQRRQTLFLHAMYKFDYVIFS